MAQLTQFESGFRGFDQSYDISLVFTKDPLRQLQKSRLAVSERLGDLLSEMRCSKI